MKKKFIALWLSGLCIILFILQQIIPGFTDTFLLNQNSYFEPWRFLTAIFLHGSLSHLLYNLFALALFGSISEALIGTKKFLLIFLSTGILANVISINFYPSSLGASGAIYGVLGALVMIRPTLTVWAFGFPMPMFIAGILWVLGNVIGIFIPSDVGNIAHLAGIFTGFIFGAFFRDWNYKRKENIKLDENEIRHWESSWMR